LIDGAGRSPLVWGSLAGGGFFALVHTGLLGDYFFQRYCAGHPVEYVETMLFFVGLAALAIKALDVAAQLRGLGRPLLDPMPLDRRSAPPRRTDSQSVPPEVGHSAADCDVLLARLSRVRQVGQDDYLLRRVRNGLESVRRTDSAENLEERLKHLADLDAEQAQASYGLMRLIVWAIPILGFLGTVIGITMAIASLRPSALEESMVEVTAGLGVAFDTTALALALSIILMFVQYYVDRAETGLLAAVDARVQAELIGRFKEVSANPDSQVAAVRRLSQAAVRSMEDTVRRQAELWQAAVEANQRHWNEVQSTAVRAAESLAAVQNTLVHKAEVLTRAVDAASCVAGLQETLNRNLAALAGAKHFEETVMSLAAAIHLLNARLGELPAKAPSVTLEPARRRGLAA
jgi:hypothetical protein